MKTATPTAAIIENITPGQVLALIQRLGSVSEGDLMKHFNPEPAYPVSGTEAQKDDWRAARADWSTLTAATALSIATPYRVTFRGLLAPCPAPAKSAPPITALTATRSTLAANH